MLRLRAMKVASVRTTRTNRWSAHGRRIGAWVLGSLPAFAFAQVKIGLVLSLTGPAASLGIPARDTSTLFPKEIAGQKVEYIVLDDASDTTLAVQDTRKLISENHVDAIIG